MDGQAGMSVPPKHPEVNAMQEPRSIDWSRWVSAAMVVGIAAFAAALPLLRGAGLSQSAALFIGLPTLVALIAVALPNGGSVTVMILKVLTIALAIAAMFFGEGAVCIIIIAPLFYAVGAVIGGACDIARKRTREQPAYRVHPDDPGKPIPPPPPGSPWAKLAVLPFALMSLEGTHPSLSFDRDEEVTVERIVVGTPDEVEARLAEVPAFGKPLPWFLRLHFPVPGATEGSGLEPGSRRRIHFVEGEGRPGDLVMEVSTREPGRAVFRKVSDSSEIAGWLEWNESDVRWRSAGPNLTRVTWTIRYQRRLDPYWYFGPGERHAVRLAAGHLIDCLATPERE